MVNRSLTQPVGPSLDRLHGSIRNRGFVLGWDGGATVAMISMGQAARLAQVGKSTLSRAIKSGKLSAERQEDGSYQIDPSELARVFELRMEAGSTGTVPEPPATLTVVRHGTQGEQLHGTLGTPGTAEMARLEAEIAGLKALLEEVKSSREEVRTERDHWRDQTHRLLASLPSPTTMSSSSATTVSGDGRGWLRRLIG